MTAGDALGTIFVVDDDAGMRSALRRMFAAAGFGVETYASAAELLAGCGNRGAHFTFDRLMKKCVRIPMPASDKR